MQDITSGIGNIAIGFQAAANNTTSQQSVVIGYQTRVAGTSGGYNVAIGGGAMYGNTGQQNVSVGYKSGYIGDGDNNIFLGAYAGTDETGSNTGILDVLDRGSEAAGRTDAPIYFVANATPANQTMQLGGGGNVSIAGELTTGNSFAEMYNPTTVISTASATTWYALSGWTAGATNAASADVVDSMLIVDQAGTYKIDLALSFTHATVSTEIECGGYKRDGAGAWTNLPQLHFERKVGTGGDIGSASFSGFAVLAAGDTLGVRINSDNTGNLTVSHGNFNVIRIK